MFRSFLQGAKLLRSLWPQAGSLNSPMALVVDPSRCLFLAGAWAVPKSLTKIVVFPEHPQKWTGPQICRIDQARKCSKSILSFFEPLRHFWGGETRGVFWPQWAGSWAPGWLVASAVGHCWLRFAIFFSNMWSLKVWGIIMIIFHLQLLPRSFPKEAFGGRAFYLGSCALF